MAFYYSRKIMLAITLAIFLAGTSPRRVSGQNCNCPPGLCCSQWGYCGTSEDYCGPGCQEGPCNSLKPASKIVSHALKNPSNQNCNCPPGLCCSQWGYCGTSEDYCGHGCQEGPCDSLKSASKIVRHALKNPSNQNCNCPPDLCCSLWGYCGTSEDYCGPGCQEGPCDSLKQASKMVLDASFNRSNQNCNCPPDLCCSQWGYCGTSEDYCGYGCQEGPCDSLKRASNAVRDAIFNGIANQAAAII